jgi:hypothetical protein
MAFSSELDRGSREENTSKKDRASVLIQSEPFSAVVELVETRTD